MRVCSKRTFWGWLNTVFNKVDYQRIKDVGPDRAAAEWLLRCGAFVKWKGSTKWHDDYNTLSGTNIKNCLIEEIDATDSCIMYIGFPYLKDLKYLKRIKFCKCMYLDDRALCMLPSNKDTLQHLEIISCGNVTDVGLTSVQELIHLKSLYLFDLPGVNRVSILPLLHKNLPFCNIEFPPTKK